MLSPFKHNVENNDFHGLADICDFVKYSAQALALAHAHLDKAYNSVYIPDDFAQAYVIAVKAWPQFKTTITDLSKNYYQQVLADHAMFKQLLSAGQIG
jgi:hypothetical protein